MLTPVLSLDTKKVRLVMSQNKTVVEKQTSEKEHEQIVMAKDYLHNHPMKISEQGLTVDVAPIASWSDKESLLTTIYCHGMNGEVALRDVDSCQRPVWLNLFRHLLLAMRDNGFLWGDCAPRNTIIDFKKKLL